MYNSCYAEGEVTKMNYEINIGKNIKELRKKAGMSQQVLADKCSISNTTLSAYENGKKIPGLTTIATIASGLQVSIDRLYYGNDNESFISAAPNIGRKIVNSIYYLWSMGVIGYYSNFYLGLSFDNPDFNGEYLKIYRFSSSIKRLVSSLNDFQGRENTFDDPDGYLEMLLSSVASEINKEIEEDNN